MALLKMSTVATIMLVLFLAASTTTFTEAQPAMSCAQQLIPCQPYLNQTITPPANCCEPIREAVTKDLTCLCNLYTDSSLLQALQVNITQAIELTGRCNIPVNISQCKAAQSPSTHPPGTPGNDGSRMGWTGISSILLLCASSLFF